MPGCVVRLAGIEPARLFRAAGFKPAVATDYTTVAKTILRHTNTATTPYDAL